MKARDATEALANALMGLVVSAAAVHVLWPVFGWHVSAPQSAAVSMIFFLLSTARAYVLRRIFRRLG